MRDPEDVLLTSLNKENKGLCNIIPKEQAGKIEKSLKID